MYLYQRILMSLEKQGALAPEDAVLVVAGGSHDRDMMHAAGLKNVTISNLDYHAGETQYAPYPWQRLDGESLELPDDSFDWVVVHAGLHHMAIPARGVCEMFRVARKGILCIEARDSLLMRVAVKLGLTGEHELEPAFLTDGTLGGYRNGPIPNFIYRWTEREFEKTVRSFAPTHEHTFFYGYAYRFPLQRFAMSRSLPYRLLGRVTQQCIRVLEFVVPKQGNQFAFGAIKNTQLQPWLTQELKVSNEYLNLRYDKARYK